MSRELEVLAELARRSAQPEPGPQGDAELRRLGLAWRRRQRRKLGGVSLVAAVAASAAALVFYLGRPGAPLTYEVEGDVAFAGRHVDVRGTAAHLSFSDGTRWELSRGARAELGAIDEHGAQLRLQSGRAHVAVVHKPRARWSVEAGPFTVRVIGTVFDVSWSADEQTLEVALSEGIVAVEGPLPQLPLSVRAGQQLVVRAREGQLRIAPITAPKVEPPVVAATAPAVAEPIKQAGPVRPVRRVVAMNTSAPSGSNAAAASPREASSSPVRGGGREGVSLQPPIAVTPAPSPPTPAPPPAPPPPPWAARIVAGEYRPVLDEALAEGLPRVYDHRSSEDLAGLSDAARYLGRRDVARDTLLAQRRRFAGSENARRAAFHLGVLADESAGAEAVRWYDLYLAEAPAGSYAPEALGRKMLAVERGAGPAAARPLAEEYRRRFSQGPYLVHALRILRVP